MEQQLQQLGLGEGDGLYRHTSRAGLILAPEETKKKEERRCLFAQDGPSS